MYSYFIVCFTIVRIILVSCSLKKEDIRRSRRSNLTSHLHLHLHLCLLLLLLLTLIYCCFFLTSIIFTVAIIILNFKANETVSFWGGKVFLLTEEFEMSTIVKMPCLIICKISEIFIAGQECSGKLCK